MQRSTLGVGGAAALLILVLATRVLAATISLDLYKIVQNPFTGLWKLGWQGSITGSDPDHVPTGLVGLYKASAGSGGPWTDVDSTNHAGSGPWTYGPKDSSSFFALDTWDFKSGVVIRNRWTMAYVTTVYSAAVLFT